MRQTDIYEELIDDEDVKLFVFDAANEFLTTNQEPYNYAGYDHFIAARETRSRQSSLRNIREMHHKFSHIIFCQPSELLLLNGTANTLLLRWRKSFFFARVIGESLNIKMFRFFSKRNLVETRHHSSLQNVKAISLVS